MKLMQNGPFIDEIWAKIAIGTLSYRWNLILVVGSQFGSNLADGSLYYHWDSNLAVRSTRAWSGPSDHAGKRGLIFRKKWPKNRQYITDKSTIYWLPRLFFLKITDLSLIANISAIYCWFFTKNHHSDISPRNIMSLASDTRYIADILRHFPPWWPLRPKVTTIMAHLSTNIVAPSHQAPTYIYIYIKKKNTYKFEEVKISRREFKSGFSS